MTAVKRSHFSIFMLFFTFVLNIPVLICYVPVYLLLWLTLHTSDQTFPIFYLILWFCTTWGKKNMKYYIFIQNSTPKTYFVHIALILADNSYNCLFCWSPSVKCLKCQPIVQTRAQRPFFYLLTAVSMTFWFWPVQNSLVHPQS